MLVSLANNAGLSANSTYTYPYACNSIQKVFFKFDDNANSFDWTCTIQLGQRVIVQSSAYGLHGMGVYNGGQGKSGSQDWFVVDLGSHQLLNNENVYVTINVGSEAQTAVDVSAIVDEPEGIRPLKYIEYSDNVFTADSVVTSISYRADQGVVDEDGYNIELRTALNSSSPSLISASNRFGAESVVSNVTFAQSYGLLTKNKVPLTTTFNYSSSAATDRILVVSMMNVNPSEVRQAKTEIARAKAVTSIK